MVLNHQICVPSSIRGVKQVGFFGKPDEHVRLFHCAIAETSSFIIDGLVECCDATTRILQA
jgi:hypothetical protein